ncbi:MAG: hypothetical protein IIT43_01490, partial [Clostridia bacterium]|nr:hypothetical protein [Clostridia bacterium]
MDDRRRTISSEESMIGEALMRVSNTLEAQRLTKSLDYQEKLRSRSNIRLILAIIALVLAGGMLIIGGFLLFVLLKYQDPILDTLVPFLKNLFGGLNTMFAALTETTTYLPVLTEQLTRMMELLLGVLNGLSGLDLGELMGYLTTMLGSATGMVVDLAGIVHGMAPLGDTMNGLLTDINAGGIGSVVNDVFSGMGIDMNVVSQMTSQAVGSVAKLADAASSVTNATLTDSNIDAFSNAAGKAASTSADLLNGLNNGLAGTDAQGAGEAACCRNQYRTATHGPSLLQQST